MQREIGLDESFNPCVSHYRREHAPNKRYLPSDITMKMMHDDFKDKHNDIVSSYDLYRSVAKETGISFTKLGHEECENCEQFSLHNPNHKKDNLELTCDSCQKWKTHIDKASSGRD